MNKSSLYSRYFFDSLQKGSRSSAEQLVPLLVDALHPKSVVDVGCGTGGWLSVFHQFGVDDILGIDGGHVPGNLLKIPKDKFLPLDLRTRFSLDRKFDLVISLEVAEHLPENSSGAFLDNLVQLGDVIVFSAAVPDQGGEGHLNEQWPEYWFEGFRRRGYEVSDCIRDLIWLNADVEWWYAQNTFLFYRSEALDRTPGLGKMIRRDLKPLNPLIHPNHYVHVKWKQRVLEAALDIVDIVPRDCGFILVDDNRMGHDFNHSRRTFKLPEKENWHWKSPPDDGSVMDVVSSLRSEGADYLVVAWPAFWWLEQRPDLRKVLASKYPVLLENDRVQVFDLRNFHD